MKAEIGLFWFVNEGGVLTQWTPTLSRNIRTMANKVSAYRSYAVPYGCICIALPLL